MNAVKLFKNSEFGEIRIVPINNEPWFIGSEIAKILSYTNPSKAIRDHVDPEEKLTERIVLAGQGRDVTLINESGLYSLILSSKLPKAKQFKHWVTGEVLPTIRKHGGYLTQEKMEEALLNPDVLIKLATQLKSERDARKQAEQLIESQKPKVIFAEAVSTSKDGILVGMLAKLLHQNGVKIGQNRLFQKLRDKGYLMKRGVDKNMPTQRSKELGLFDVGERVVGNPDGSIRLTRTPVVTGKGQVYFINLFLKKKEAK
jgi:anti-repressor protein